jgi:hypothetical protein
MKMDHHWKPCETGPYLMLEGHKDSLVRTWPSPDGRILWQFRGVASYADTIEAAKDYVEAGVEYFDVMRRSPYLTR